MTDLERRLAALGADLDLPEAPYLAPAVLAGLAAGPPRRRLRPLAVALAAVLLALGVAFAVPPARSALLDWLGIGGVEIERVPELPALPEPPPAGASLDLGVRVSLAEARRRTPFPVGVPADPALGPPAEVWLQQGYPGPRVSLVYPGVEGDRPALLLTQFRADGLRFVEKAAGPGTRIEPVTVDGGPGVWLTGEPHFFAYVAPDGSIVEDTPRLAGDVLLWQRGDVTFRLEGAQTLDEALAIAGSVA